MPGCRSARAVVLACSSAGVSSGSTLRAFAPSRLRDCGVGVACAVASRACASFTNVPPGSRRTVLRRDVVAQPEIRGMPQPALVGPLGEAHLRHQLGLHPVRRLVGRRRRHVEGRRLALERGQQLRQPCQLALGEPRADVADIGEPALVVVDAEEQGAEVRAVAARLGPAADDELLRMLQLELGPVGGSLAREVARRGALGDQPFPAPRHRLAVQVAAVPAHLRRQTQQGRAGIAEDAFERGAPRGQGQPAQVVGALAQQVEGNERRRRVVGRADVLAVDPALQVLKADGLAARVERDDLAVEQHRLAQPQGVALQRLDDGGKLRGLVVARARPEAHRRHGPSGRDANQRTHAVVLRFVHEVGMRQRGLDRRGQHRPDLVLSFAPCRYRHDARIAGYAVVSSRSASSQAASGSAPCSIEMKYARMAISSCDGCCGAADGVASAATVTSLDVALRRVRGALGASAGVASTAGLADAAAGRSGVVLLSGVRALTHLSASPAESRTGSGPSIMSV